VATYEVSYVTTTKPEAGALPANARVVQTSALPAKVEQPGGTVKVRRRGTFLGKSTAAELALVVTEPLREGSRTIGLSEDACRELGAALVAAADEAKAEREKEAGSGLEFRLTNALRDPGPKPGIIARPYRPW
jgi:hypothetical protein